MVSKLAGGGLRIGQTILRAIELLACILILGIFSYYLASLSHHHLPIHRWIRAVEGISGAGVLYLCFAVLLTIFLGAHRFFALIAVILDICFAGCFIAVAYLTRGGAGSCSGYVNTPLGSGPSNSKAAGYGANNFGFGTAQTTSYSPNLHLACKLETAVFAVSIFLIFMFLVTAAMQVLLAKHHQKEKRYGPSPTNNYTSGSGKTPFWRRMGRNKQTHHTTRDAEMATAGSVRRSHETGMTGTTYNHGPGVVDEPKYGQPGYGQNGVTPGHHATTGTNY